jgi:hypothetical protein
MQCGTFTRLSLGPDMFGVGCPHPPSLPQPRCKAAMLLLYQRLSCTGSFTDTAVTHRCRRQQPVEIVWVRHDTNKKGMKRHQP